MKYTDFIIAVALFCLTVWGIYLAAPRIIKAWNDRTTEIVEKVDTIRHTDTLWVEKTHTDTIFKTKTITKQKTDTLYRENGDSMVVNLTQKSVGNTVEMDGDTITYNAYLTGRSYEGEDYPKMDSISFVLRAQKVKEVETITIEKIIKQRARKWHLGAYAGYGWTPTTGKLEPSIGVGINYNIW